MLGRRRRRGQLRDTERHEKPANTALLTGCRRLQSRPHRFDSGRRLSCGGPGKIGAVTSGEAHRLRRSAFGGRDQRSDHVGIDRDRAFYVRDAELDVAALGGGVTVAAGGFALVGVHATKKPAATAGTPTSTLQYTDAREWSLTYASAFKTVKGLPATAIARQVTITSLPAPATSRVAGRAVRRRSHPRARQAWVRPLREPGRPMGSQTMIVPGWVPNSADPRCTSSCGPDGANQTSRCLASYSVTLGGRCRRGPRRRDVVPAQSRPSACARPSWPACRFDARGAWSRERALQTWSSSCRVRPCSPSSGRGASKRCRARPRSTRVESASRLARNGGAFVSRAAATPQSRALRSAGRSPRLGPWDPARRRSSPWHPRR